MKRFILIICQLIFISAMHITAQIQVSTVAELENEVANAVSDVTITLAESFVSGNMSLTQPSVNVTVDGADFIWNTGVITVSGSGIGTLTIKNLKMDGTASSQRLFSSTSSNGKLILKKIEFYNSKGGAIDISTSGSDSTVIFYANIHNNTAYNTAAAIWVGGSSNLTINNSTIENNIGTGGGYECGAIGSKSHTGNLEINNTVFRNNKNQCSNTGVIGGGGGAMSLHYFKGNLTINESLFQRNEANGAGVEIKPTYDGGAIYIFDGRDGAKININKTTFDSNLSYDDGGALLIQGTGNPGLTTTITNCTFYNNKAYGLSGGNRSGGAIMFFKNGGSSLMTNTILSSTFVGNKSGNQYSTVNQQGGAIGLSGAGILAIATVTYNGSLFVGNKVYDLNGVLNDASTYKDISNSTTTQAGAKNVINVDKDATPAYTDEDVLGKNYSLSENLSGVKAGVNDEIVKTIPIKPQGIADNTYNGTATLPTTDQRNFSRSKDQGAVEMVWVRFDANGGTWTGLNDSFDYDGIDYYKSTSSETGIYFKVTYLNGKVILPSATLTPPMAGQIATWVIDDGSNVEWNPADSVTNNVWVKAIWKTKYTVTYDGGGSSGGTVPTDAALYDEDALCTVLAQGTLTKTGYTFVGWVYSENNAITYQAGETFNMPATHVTLTAKWIKKAPIIDPVDPEIEPEPIPEVEPTPEPEPEIPVPEPEIGITLQRLQLICSNETMVTIPFELLYKDKPIHYLVKLSDQAKAAGWIDETTYKPLPTNKTISFTIPLNMLAGTYSGTIVLKTDSSNVLILNYPFVFEIMTSVKIIKHPVSVSRLCEGDGFKLTVEAMGDEVAYQWYLNNKKIPEANKSTYEAALTKENKGVYVAEVIGVCGAEISEQATISSNTFSIQIKWDDVLYVLNLDNRYGSYQWYKDGSPIEQYGKAVYYTHPDGLLGTYNVRAYKADGTYDESCSITFEQKTKATSTAVYPNPVERSANLSVVISDLEESKATIDMYDMAGKHVYNAQTTTTKTDIPVNLPTGTYVIQIRLESGKTINQKFIVK